MSDSKNATVSKFKFKSVGVPVSQESRERTAIKNNAASAQIGIKTPVRNTGHTEIFDMHSDPREQLKDNLKNLILTNQGERLVSYQFGANLKDVLYDFSKVQDYQSLVGNQIRAAVEKYIPVINIDELQAIVVDEEEKNL